MAAEWFILMGSGEQGPFTPAQLKELATYSRILPGTKVKKGVDGEWVPAGRVKGLFEVSKPPPPPPPIPREETEDFAQPQFLPVPESPGVAKVAQQISLSRRMAVAAGCTLFLLGLTAGVTLAPAFRWGSSSSRRARVEEKLEELQASSRVAQHVFPGLLPDEAYDDETLRYVAETMVEEENKNAEEERIRNAPPPGPYTT